MSHLPILPILIAAFAGFALTLASRGSLAMQRGLGLAALALNLLVSMTALGAVASGDVIVYALSDWPAPYGIVLVLDRLSALMVLLTSVVALFAAFAGIRGGDREGRMFHALFQFQLMGLYGAFLTGDIFNLFVFFEILLIASYGLLLHGRGPARSRAGLKYVVVNLTGSALFLVAVGTLYGVTGTLNMADLARVVPTVSEGDQALLRASAFLFLVVFGTKAALLPLFFWLPDTYSSATAPVASLFAIMTKVGIYALLRVYTVIFGAPEAAVGAAIAPWLLAAALLTLAVGMVGALQARTLGRLVAYLAVASVGTTMTAFAQFDAAAIQGGLYYMVHSTLAVAALFLLVEPIRQLRGYLGDRLEQGPQLRPWATLGLVYTGLAVAMAGLPPLSGFLGKAMILNATIGHPQVILIWSTILVTSLFAVIAVSRAGSTLFWKSDADGATTGVAVSHTTLPAGGLLAAIVVLTVYAGPFDTLAAGIADDLLSPAEYIEAVLSNRTVVTVEG